jgi:TolB-like protein/tetratricopeptide (TPR) repeat protein
VKDEEAKKKYQEEALQPASTASITQHQVVAVLPFLNQTGNSEFDYLADGITDNLINNLSRLSNIHVLSHSTVSAFRTTALIPQQVGRQLDATVVLFGRLSLRPTGIAVVVELVDTSTGWQLWGETFDSEDTGLPEIQNTITQGLLKALKSILIDEKEKPTTARYTESTEAYNSYLEGRREWSKFTRVSINKAVTHFLDAIESDPNYALAYAGIVDCFLRLATNYLPQDVVYTREIRKHSETGSQKPTESNSRVELRYEWDCKAAERELRRAHELKTGYPSAHQWYAAYRTTQKLYDESDAINFPKGAATVNTTDTADYLQLPTQITFLELTSNEEVQVYCVIGRDQIDIGNYNAACKILKPWWSFGVWPKLDGLNQQSCADLLLTVGELAGCVASTQQLPRGQKHSEELLNGSIALFEQLGFRKLAAEARIELAYCYFRQGLYNVGRSTLTQVLDELTQDCWELRSLALIRLAALERQAGRRREALTILSRARPIAELCGPWATGRCHLELASTFVAEHWVDYFDEARSLYSTALEEFEGIGNHRLSAITENNLGLLMSTIGDFNGAELHLLRARKTFDSFEDRIRCAQVDESLAQLYSAQGRFDEAHVSIQRAIQTMEDGDEDAFLTEALTTKGLIYCKLKRYGQAKTLLENAYRLAQRCGDTEGAGRSLAVLVEEMFDLLEPDERNDIGNRINAMISCSHELSIHSRLQKCLAIARLRQSSGDTA